MKKKLSLNEEIFDIIDEFTFFDDWSDKYQHLIDQGKKIERIEENLKIEKNKIKGCQSNVYFFSKTDDNGIILSFKLYLLLYNLIINDHTFSNNIKDIIKSNMEKKRDVLCAFNNL